MAQGDADRLAPSRPFGEWLRTERTRRTMTRAELAAKSGVSPMQISNPERGRAPKRNQPREKSWRELLRFTFQPRLPSRPDEKSRLVGFGRSLLSTHTTTTGSPHGGCLRPI